MHSQSPPRQSRDADSTRVRALTQTDAGSCMQHSTSTVMCLTRRSISARCCCHGMLTHFFTLRVCYGYLSGYARHT